MRTETYFEAAHTQNSIHPFMDSGCCSSFRIEIGSADLLGCTNELAHASLSGLSQNTETLADLARRKISEETITAFDLGFGNGYLALYSVGIHEVIAVYGAHGLKPSFAKQISQTGRVRL